MGLALSDASSVRHIHIAPPPTRALSSFIIGVQPMTRLLALFFVLTMVACSSSGSAGQNMISPAQIRSLSSNSLTIYNDLSVVAEAFEPCCPPQNGCFAYLPSDKNVYEGYPETFSPHSNCPYNGTYYVSDLPTAPSVTCTVSLTYHSTGYTFGLTNGSDTACTLVTNTDGSGTMHYKLATRSSRPQARSST